MNFAVSFLQAVSILIGIIGVGVLLRTLGFLKEEHGSVLSGIVTNVTLPALIFSSLSVHKISAGQVKLAGLMMSAELVCIAIAWLAADRLKLSRPQKGAMILSAGFGSSAFLGYAIVRQVFRGNSLAISDAVVISELGVGTLIFTLGVVLAMYFGSDRIEPKEIGKVFLKFLSSPIFISVVLGIVWPFLGIPMDNALGQAIYKFLDVLKNANTILVGLTIGLLLHFHGFRSVFPIVIAVCLIKLVLQPVIAVLPAGFLGFPNVWRKVLLIEAGMPAATLAAVFSARYGCDGRLAAVLIFTTKIASIFTVVTLSLVFVG